MSERRPFTRGGRHLTLVRPRAPVPLSPLAQFWRMLLRPAAGVAQVLWADPGLMRLAVGLAVVGLLRGVVEGFWYYLMTDQLHELLLLIGRVEWYTRYGGPFLPHLSRGDVL